MKVSFIVPVFNETKLTQACLDSLEKTLPADLSYEIIVVDDGSDTQTANQLDGFQHRNLQIIHSPKNRGFAAANNLGPLPRAMQGERLTTRGVEHGQVGGDAREEGGEVRRLQRGAAVRTLPQLRWEALPRLR